MKFKKGDIVFCINNKYGNGNILNSLEINKKYTISGTYYDIDGVTRLSFIEINNGVKYRSDRFISLEQFRSNKIKKIKYNINNEI